MEEPNEVVELFFRKDRGVTDYELVKTFWIQEKQDFGDAEEEVKSLKPLELAEKASEDSEVERLPEEILNEPMEDDVFEEEDVKEKREEANEEVQNSEGVEDVKKTASEDVAPENSAAVNDVHGSEDVPADGKDSEVASGSEDVKEGKVQATDDVATPLHTIENLEALEDVAEPTFTDPYSRNLAAAFGIHTPNDHTNIADSEDVIIDLLFREPTHTAFELVYTIPLMEDVAISDQTEGVPPEDVEEADFTFTSPEVNDEETFTLTTEVVTVLENPNLKSDDTFDDEEEEAFQNAFVKSVETPCAEDDVFEARAEAEDVEKVLKDAAEKLETLGAPEDVKEDVTDQLQPSEVTEPVPPSENLTSNLNAASEDVEAPQESGDVQQNLNAPSESLVASQYDNVIEGSEDVEPSQETLEDSQTPEVAPEVSEDVLSLPGEDDSHVEKFVAMVEEQLPVDVVRDFETSKTVEHQESSEAPVTSEVQSNQEDVAPVPEADLNSEDVRREDITHQKSLEDTLESLVVKVEQNEEEVVNDSEDSKLPEDHSAEDKASEDVENTQEDDVIASEEHRPSNVHFIIGDSSESAADLASKTIESEDAAILEDAKVDDPTIAPEEMPRAEAVTPEEVPSIPNLTVIESTEDVEPTPVAFIVGASTDSVDDVKASEEKTEDVVNVVDQYVAGLVKDIVKNAMEGVDLEGVKVKIVVTPEVQEDAEETLESPEDINVIKDSEVSEEAPHDAPEAVKEDVKNPEEVLKLFETSEVVPEGLDSSISAALEEINAVKEASDALTTLEDVVAEKIEDPEVVKYLEALEQPRDVPENTDVTDETAPEDVTQSEEAVDDVPIEVVEAAAEVHAVIEALKTVETSQVPDGVEDAVKEEVLEGMMSQTIEKDREMFSKVSEDVKPSEETEELRENDKKTSENLVDEKSEDVQEVEASSGMMSVITDTLANVVDEVQETLKDSEGVPEDSIFEAVPAVGVPPEDVMHQKDKVAPEKNKERPVGESSENVKEAEAPGFLSSIADTVTTVVQEVQETLQNSEGVPEDSIFEAVPAVGVPLEDVEHHKDEVAPGENKERPVEESSEDVKEAEAPGVLSSIVDTVTSVVDEVQETLQDSEGVPKDSIFEAVPAVGVPLEDVEHQNDEAAPEENEARPVEESSEDVKKPEAPGVLSSIAETVTSVVDEVQETLKDSEGVPEDSIFEAVPAVGVPPEDADQKKDDVPENPEDVATKITVTDQNQPAPDEVKEEPQGMISSIAEAVTTVVEEIQEEIQNIVIGAPPEDVSSAGSEDPIALAVESAINNVDGSAPDVMKVIEPSEASRDPEDVQTAVVEVTASVETSEVPEEVNEELNVVFQTSDNFGAVPEGVEDVKTIEDAPEVSSDIITTADNFGAVPEQPSEYDGDVSAAPEEVSDDVPEDVQTPEAVPEVVVTPAVPEAVEVKSQTKEIEEQAPEYDADVNETSDELPDPEELLSDIQPVEEITSQIRREDVTSDDVEKPITTTTVTSSDADVNETSNDAEIPDPAEILSDTQPVLEITLKTLPEGVTTSEDVEEPVSKTTVTSSEAAISGVPHRIADVHFDIPKQHEDYGNDYVPFGTEKEEVKDSEHQEQEDVVTELHFQPIRQWRDEDVISLQSLKSLVAEVGCTTETEVEAVLNANDSPEDVPEEETLKILKVVPSEPSLLELDFSDPNVIEVPIPLLEPATRYLHEMVEWIIADAIKEVGESKEVVTESEIDEMVPVPEPLIDMKFPDEEKTPEPEEAPEDKEKTPEPQRPPRAPKDSKVRFGPLNIKLGRTYSEEQKALEEMLERPLKVITSSPLGRPQDEKAPEDEEGAMSPLSPGTLAEYEHIPTMEMQSVPHSPAENERVGEEVQVETRILSPGRSKEDVDDEGSECLDSIGDLSERTIQRFNTSIDDPSIRRDSFSSISSFGDRQKFRTAIENIRQDLLPFQSSVSQYLDPSANVQLVANLSMDSPSDLSPNAPPAGYESAFLEKKEDRPSAEGSIDSSGFEKVDHEGLEEFAAHGDPMQQSVFGSLQADDDDRRTPEDGFVFIERSSTPKKMSSHHDDVIEKNYQAETAALLESPIAEEARKLVQDAVESASELKKQAVDDGDDIGKELLDNVHETAQKAGDNIHEHVVEPVTDALHRAYDGLGDFVEHNVKEPVKEHIVEPVHDSYDKVADFVETVKENAPKQVDEFTREHRPEPEVLPELQENIHDSVDKVHDEIDNFLRGARAPSPPQEDVDDFQDQKPHFGNQTPEEDETTFDRNGPLTIPEEVVNKVDDLADFDPLVTSNVGQEFGAAVGSAMSDELTEEEMFGHQKFETVPRPPTPPKDISDEDVKPSIVDLGPAHHHSHPSSPHHSILKHHGEAWIDFKTVPPCVLDVIYWRDAKKSAIVLSLALLALFVLAKYPLLTVVTYSLLLALGAAAGFRVFKKVEAQIKKTDAEHPFQEILSKDISLPQEKVHAQADVFVEHATCLINKLKSLVFVESPFESLKFGLVLWSLTYIASWFSGFTLAILALLGVFSVPKVYESNQEAIDPHLATIQGHLKNVQNLIDEKLPFLRSAPVAAEEKKDQ